MSSPTSYVLITEITGLRRSVRLVGAGLPFQGASWGVQLRNKTTWYPGNAQQATQHILGPVEADSDWEGFWRTTQLIRTPAQFTDENHETTRITSAFSLMQVMEDVCRRGATLSVEWGDNLRDLNRRLVREGIADEINFRVDRADDISWTITWKWSGRGVQQQKVAAFRTEDGVAKIRDAILRGQEILQLEALDTIVSKRRDVRNSASQFSLGQLENLAKAPLEITRSFTRKIQQIVGRFKKLGEIINQVRSLPTQLANQGLDQAANAVSVCNNFIDTMSRKPPEALTARARLSNLTRSLTFYGDAMTTSKLLRRSAQGLRTQLEGSQKQASTILAVHVCRARYPNRSETLASISITYYGVPDYAAGIAKANGLPLNQVSVSPGDILTIPTLSVIKGFNATSG
jgi:hypothetical protein